MNKDKLIFIGGCMRSGTTILHRVLCAAKEAHPYITESWYLIDQLRIYRWCLQRYDVRHKDYFGEKENFDQFTRSILHNYFSMTRARYSPATALVLKNPEATVEFPLLGNWFKEAKFLINVRDPRDTIASIIEVGERHTNSGLWSTQTKMGRDMKKLSTFFKRYYINLLSPRAEQIKDRMVFVRYEDLMTDPQKILTGIADFCDLTFDMEQINSFGSQQIESPNMDKELREKDPFSAAFWSELYTKELSASRIGRYAETLSPEEIKEIETHCADFNKIFSYW